MSGDPRHDTRNPDEGENGKQDHHDDQHYVHRSRLGSHVQLWNHCWILIQNEVGQVILRFGHEQRRCAQGTTVERRGSEKRSSKTEKARLVCGEAGTLDDLGTGLENSFGIVFRSGSFQLFRNGYDSILIHAELRL